MAHCERRTWQTATPKISAFPVLIFRQMWKNTAFPHSETSPQWVRKLDRKKNLFKISPERRFRTPSTVAVTRKTQNEWTFPQVPCWNTPSQEGDMSSGERAVDVCLLTVTTASRRVWMSLWDGGRVNGVHSLMGKVTFIQNFDVLVGNELESEGKEIRRQ